MSTCFTSLVREIIQLQWDAYENVRESIAGEATEFGILHSQLVELVSWAKGQQNTNYLIFEKLGPPLELLERFITDPAARVVGIGLHTSLLESFHSQLTKDINQGLGLAELVTQKLPLAEGGVPLGFEPLGFEGTHFHSWLCHGTPDEAFKHFDIRPNQFGLIDTFESARRVNQYLLATEAEPAIWEPWLVVDYAAKRAHV
jgi:hypothetical protein